MTPSSSAAARPARRSPSASPAPGDASPSSSASRSAGPASTPAARRPRRMVASAYAAHMARRAAEFGVVIERRRIGGHAAGEAAQGRHRRVMERGNRGIAAGDGELHRRPRPCPVRRATRDRGRRRTARRGADLHQCRRPGCRCRRSPASTACRTSPTPSCSSLDVVPQHLVVVGGSYVGLEFAQIFRRFGAEVTVLESAPRLVPREDAEISAAIRALLESEGVRIVCGVTRRGRGAGTAWRRSQRDAPTATRMSIEGSHLLLAVGRRPNTDDLGLDRAGVAVDARGYIIVDDSCAPTSPASGRSATATAAARSPTPPTTTSKSSPPICSMASEDGERPHRRLCAVHRSAARPRRDDRGRGTRRPATTCWSRSMAMADVARAIEKGETAG